MRRTIDLWIYLVLLAGQLAVGSPWARAADEGLTLFEQKIRPVLVQHCYSCHSQEARESKKLQGALYLDTSAGVLAGGENGPAIVKGKSAESLLLKALRYDGLEMPPSGKLPDDVIADFSRWIDLGAPDPREGSPPLQSKREINLEEGRRWWSFQPLRPVAPPSAGAADASPIDRFLQARHQELGLNAAPPATKAKLLRRAYFDLIGLPPTPEQLQSFLADNSPQAFERVVDQLLESQAYGEKWARHWLDAVRYAESGGYEFDGFRPGAFHYRDWVIRALNRDLPYDQFVKMQIAGELLYPDEYDAAAAVGFLVAGPYPGQITAKTVERIRYDQLDDMLMTIGGSMLGLTVGCVRCHEHKYDPIPQQDYYGLAATFQRTSHGTRLLDPDPQATMKSQRDHLAGLAPLQAALNKFAQEQLPQRLDAWRSNELPKLPDAPRWQQLEPIQIDAERSWLKWTTEGLLIHDGAITPGTVIAEHGQLRRVASGEVYRIAARTFQKNITSLRLDAFADKSLPQRGPGLNGDGSFQLAEFKVIARPLDPQVKEPAIDLKLKPSFAAFADPDQPLGNSVDGKPETAWVVRATARTDNAAVWELETPLAGFAGGTELHFELLFVDLGIGRLRLAISTDPNPATWAGDFRPQHLGELRTMLAAHANNLPESQRPFAAQWLAAFDADTAKSWNPVRDHAIQEPRAALSEVYTAVPGGQDVYFLRRGEVDAKQGIAPAGVVQVLHRAGVKATNAATEAVPADPRVVLANWMTDVESGAGPLLARVLVNRIWQHHFGQGLVGTPNDFGVQGERPTHPDLLEWLATEMVQGGWKWKPVHRKIMLSAAYQRSHEVAEHNLAIDAENRNYWHFQPRRLDAEIIRDSLLTVGGNLEPKMFGPSELDNSLRRSVYLRVKRSELIPWMSMFDAPEPTQSIGMRISTTVPTQALAMMNSPFVRQQAEKLAQRISSSGAATAEQRIERGFLAAFSRLPTAAEAEKMTAFLQQQKNLSGEAQASNDEQALVEFCQVLFCLNEFLYVD